METQDANRETIIKLKVEIENLLQSHVNQVDTSMPSIDHDLLENLESRMKHFINENLENYVRVAEIDDMIINQLARGFSPSQAANLPAGFQEEKLWRSELQKIRDEFLRKNDFYEEIKLIAPTKPLPAPPLPASRPPSLKSGYSRV